MNHFRFAAVAIVLFFSFSVLGCVATLKTVQTHKERGEAVALWMLVKNREVDSAVRMEALQALGDMEDDSASHLLATACLSGFTKELQQAACNKCIQRPNKKIVTTLFGKYEPHVYITLEAIYQKTQDDRIFNHFKDFVLKGSSNHQIVGLDFIARNPRPEIVVVLLQAMQSTDNAVTAKAQKILDAHFNTTQPSETAVQSVPSLLAVIEKNPDAPEVARIYQLISLIGQPIPLRMKILLLQNKELTQEIADSLLSDKSESSAAVPVLVETFPLVDYSVSTRLELRCTRKDTRAADADLHLNETDTSFKIGDRALQGDLENICAEWTDLPVDKNVLSGFVLRYVNRTIDANLFGKIGNWINTNHATIPRTDELNALEARRKSATLPKQYREQPQRLAPVSFTLPIAVAHKIEYSSYPRKVVITATAENFISFKNSYKEYIGAYLLSRITGKKFDADKEKWTAWLEQNQDKFPTDAP